jgi:AcrR family transcriptional regulator
MGDRRGKFSGSTRRVRMQRRVDGHWLLKREQPRRRIDPSDVVKRAHALVHEGGAGSLTMRPLAASLGTSTSALYRLVPSRAWLLVAIVDLVFSEVDTSVASGRARPRVRLERLSRALRDVLSAHPHLHEVLASHVAVTPSTVHVAEAAMRCLREAGIKDAELIDAYNAWIGFVVGFTVIEMKPADLGPEPALQKAMQAQLSTVDRESHPVVSGLSPERLTQAYGLSWKPEPLGEARSSFEWGLKVMLDGIAP